MKKDLKKVFSFILVLMLVFSLIPTPSAFAYGDGLEKSGSYADPTTTVPAVLANGQIWTDKSVKDNGDGTFDITLKAIGQNYESTEVTSTPLDVVLLLDWSISMGSGSNSRLDKMQNAAKSAANIILSKNVNSRVAIVKYSDMGTKVLDFTKYNNISAVNSAITSSYTSGSTNIQNGLYVAQQLIQSRSGSNKPVIILMTDGDPTYYHNTLSGQTSSSGYAGSRQGSGNPSNTGNAYVWQTVLQAMYAKNSIPNLDIYTIGFGVDSLTGTSKAHAKATLQFDTGDTSTYAPSPYYTGSFRDLSGNAGNIQYAAKGNTPDWSQARLTNQSSTDQSNPASYGISTHYRNANITGNPAWTTFSGLYTAPWSSLTAAKSGSALGSSTSTPTETWVTGSNKYSTAFFTASAITGTEYKDVSTVNSKATFPGRYWTQCILTGEDQSAITKAFNDIANTLTTLKPNTVINGQTRSNSNVVINDVLGTGFDIVSESLDPTKDIVCNAGTVTWTIRGDDLPTVAPNTAALDASQILQTTFKVRIKSSVTAGPQYYTNQSAASSFTASHYNPYYGGATFTGSETRTANGSDWTITKALTNNGWIQFYAPDIQKSITITKHVVGPVDPSETRTFDFNVYYHLNANGMPDPTDEPITSASITVTGAGVASVTLPLTFHAGDFSSGSLSLYVKEMNNAPAGSYWQYDTWHTVTINKTDENAANVSFTNTYAPKGTLTVKKVWSSVSGEDVVTGGAVEYRLLKEVPSGAGVAWVPAEDFTRTLDKDHDWTDTIGNLDLDTNYSVQEIDNNNALHDYVIGYDPSSVTFAPGALSRQINIINAYKTPTGKITIVKTWDDNSNAAGDRPSEINFSYTDPKGMENTVTFGPDDNSKDNNSDVWTFTMAPTPNFGTYTFEELPVKDYTAAAIRQNVTIDQEPVDGRDGTVSFTNTYVTPAGIITVIKQWLGDDGDKSYRPSSIKVTLQKLLKIDGADADASVDGNWTDVKTLTIGSQAGNYWTDTFNNLTEWGTYRVVEDEVSDYNTTYSSPSGVTLGKDGQRSGDLYIYNSFANPKGSITVNKIWVDNATTSAVRPDEVTVKLLKNGETVSSAALTGSGYPETTWSHTFNNLDLDGATYTVEESAAENYDVQVTYSGITAEENGIVLDKEYRTGTANIYNTYAKGVIAVSKHWEHGTIPESHMPDGVSLTLMKHGPVIVTEESIETDGDVTYSAIVTKSSIETVPVETKTIDGASDGTVIFYNLDMGDDYKYYVEEDNVPPLYHVSYTNSKSDPVVLTDENPNGYITVTNTYDEPKGELTVTKEWGENYDPDRPDNVKVNLIMGTNTVVDTVTLSDDNDWTYTFKDLDLGITYSAIETTIGGVAADQSNYIVDYTGDTNYVPTFADIVDHEQYGFVTITNSYKSVTGCLTVNKAWEGTTGGPITVTVTRYENGKLDDGWYADATLSEENNWGHTFENLPLYGKDDAYTYNVDESGDLTLYQQVIDNDHPVPHELSLIANEENTVTITNAYKPDLGKLTIKKEWQGTNSIPNVTIDAILVTVGENTSGPSIQLSAANDWQQVITGLDVTKTYKLVEQNKPEAYDVTYNYGEGSEAIAFTSSPFEASATIINHRTQDNPGLGLEKVIFNPNIVLDDSGKATFRYALYISNNGNRTLNDIYVLDTMTPSGSAVNAKLEYSKGDKDGDAVRIEIPEGLAPGAAPVVVYYNVTVDKAGTYDNKAIAYASYDGDGSVDSTPAEASGLVKAPGLQITKEVVGSNSKSGGEGTFSYKLTISNKNEFDLKNVNVTDEMKSSNDNATITYNNTSEDFKIGDLLKGDQKVIEYTVSLTGTGTYDNTATVTGEYSFNDDSGQDPTTGTLSDSASATVTVTSGGGGGGGGGGHHNTDNPTPQTPVIIPEEETPAAPAPAPSIDQIIPDQAVPAGPLPKTGGLDALFLYGLGALLAGGGTALKLRNRKNKNDK